MDPYVTGAIIKKLREKKKLTQAELAARLNVSDKAVSKWETGKGYPDITLMQALADSLGISVIELLAGSSVTNTNRSFHMGRMKFYVCPICGNVLAAAGEAVISCCGVSLPPLEAEVPDSEHTIRTENVEDEIYVTIPHEMTKQHFISFLAAVGENGVELVKQYPEGPCEARFRRSRVQKLYAYCNHHGLFAESMKNLWK